MLKVHLERAIPKTVFAKHTELPTPVSRFDALTALHANGVGKTILIGDIYYWVGTGLQVVIYTIQKDGAILYDFIIVENKTKHGSVRLSELLLELLNDHNNYLGVSLPKYLAHQALHTISEKLEVLISGIESDLDLEKGTYASYAAHGEQGEQEEQDEQGKWEYLGKGTTQTPQSQLAWVELLNQSIRVQLNMDNKSKTKDKLVTILSTRNITVALGMLVDVVSVNKEVTYKTIVYTNGIENQAPRIVNYVNERVEEFRKNLPDTIRGIL